MADPIKRIRKQAEQFHAEAADREAQADALEQAADVLEASGQEEADAQAKMGDSEDEDRPPQVGRRGGRR